MSKKTQKEITFPRYFAALKAKKLKEYSFNALMLCIQLVGIIGMLLLAYGFLVGLDRRFNQEIDPYEQGVERTDYSPYSGWTYE